MVRAIAQVNYIVVVHQPETCRRRVEKAQTTVRLFLDDTEPRDLL